MHYGNKLLNLAIFLAIGGYLAFDYFERVRHGDDSEAAQLSAPQQVLQTVPVLRQQDAVVQREPERIAQFEYVVHSRNEPATKTVADVVEDCADCLQFVAEFLGNPVRQTADKVALGRALMQPASQAETLRLVSAILDAHLAGDAALKEGLLQALDDAQTPESAAALISVIANGVSGAGFHQLPDDLQFAIRNAIRLNPFPVATGQMLAAQYNYQASPEVAAELENLEQPVMLSILAKQFHDGGDVSRAEQLTRQLSSLDDARTLDGLMLLGENNVVPLEKVNGMAYAWVKEHSDQFDQERYAAYLSNFDTNVTQRSVAAFALAASQDAASAFYALKKASSYEADPLVRSSLEFAINLILDPSTRPLLSN